MIPPPPPPPRAPGRASTFVGKTDAASRAMDAREIAIFTMTRSHCPPCIEIVIARSMID
jgi:hypothetical protein